MCVGREERSSKSQEDGKITARDWCGRLPQTHATRTSVNIVATKNRLCPQQGHEKQSVYSRSPRFARLLSLYCRTVPCQR